MLVYRFYSHTEISATKLMLFTELCIYDDFTCSNKLVGASRYMT